MKDFFCIFLFFVLNLFRIKRNCSNFLLINQNRKFCYQTMLRDLVGIIEKNDSVSQNSQNQSKISIYDEDIQSLPKKQIHPILFILNILWMLFCLHANIYYIYGPGITQDNLNKKGAFAAVALSFTILIAVPTFLYLVSLKQLFRLAIIFDNIMVVTIAATIAFIYLILLFDKTDDWYWSMMEAGFAIEIPFYSTMFRVFFVHLKWTKWKLIVFKLSLMINSLMLLVLGIYFICVNFSYTKNMLKSFDEKVHEFMVLFVFSLFTYTYQLYCKVTDLDGTGQLRFVYNVKNIDQSLVKKKKSIIKKKRDSINSLNFLRKSIEQHKEEMKHKISRFAQIQVISDEISQ